MGHQYQIRDTEGSAWLAPGGDHDRPGKHAALNADIPALGAILPHGAGGMAATPAGRGTLTLALDQDGKHGVVGMCPPEPIDQAI